MTTQPERAQRFRALHQRPGCFLIPNPWDAGSARLLAELGFEALATTSAGLAFSTGRPDGARALSLEETLANAGSISNATHLPVSADLENGFGDDPEQCAETIRQAAAAGLVGGSIEDATGHDHPSIYPFELAVKRMRAAVAAARELPFPFVLTARADNHLHGHNDLDDTINRLQAFAEVGADVLYAPGLRGLAQIETVTRAVAPRCVNVVMGLGDVSFSVGQLQAAGVKRISVGSALARTAYAALQRAGQEMLQRGTFSFAQEAVPFLELNARFC